MLKFWAKESITIERADRTRTTYTVYPDDTDDGLFYVIPDTPTLRWVDPGRTLAFQFIKYRGTVQRGGRACGGYVVFDVELRVPAADLRLLEDALAARGATAKVRVSTPPITDGTVELLVPTRAGTDTSTGIAFERIKTLGKPSLTGNHVACFAAELGEHAATFFYDALTQGDGTQIQVGYTLKTWARTADTTLTVSYDVADVLDYVQKIERLPPATIWSEGTHKDTIRETLTRSGAGKVDLVGGDGLGKEERAALSAYGQELLTAAMETELEAVLPPDPEQRKAMMDRGATELISQIRHCASYRHTLRERFAFELPVIVQGGLAKPSALLGAGYDEAAYFRRAELDDPFFRTLQLAITPSINFDTAPIRAVKVDVDYHGKTWSTSFTKDQRTRVAWSSAEAPPPFVALVGGAPDLAYDLRYEVLYDQDGDVQRVVAPPVRAATSEYVLAVGAEAMQSLELDATLLDRESYASVEVNVTFLHADGVQRVEATPVVFTKDSTDLKPRIFQVIGPDAPSYRAYEYTVEYRIGGKPYPIGPTRGTARTVRIRDLLADPREVTVRLSPPPAAGATATVSLEFSDRERGYRRRTTRTLAAATQFATRWAFGAFDDAPGVLRVSGELVAADGTITPLATREVAGDIDTLALRVAQG
jgi:hypothetical protein